MGRAKGNANAVSVGARFAQAVDDMPESEHDATADDPTTETASANNAAANAKPTQAAALDATALQRLFPVLENPQSPQQLGKALDEIAYAQPNQARENAIAYASLQAVLRANKPDLQVEVNRAWQQLNLKDDLASPTLLLCTASDSYDEDVDEDPRTVVHLRKSKLSEHKAICGRRSTASTGVYLYQGLRGAASQHDHCPSCEKLDPDNPEWNEPYNQALFGDDAALIQESAHRRNRIHLGATLDALSQAPPAPSGLQPDVHARLGREADALAGQDITAVYATRTLKALQHKGDEALIEKHGLFDNREQEDARDNLYPYINEGRLVDALTENDVAAMLTGMRNKLAYRQTPPRTALKETLQKRYAEPVLRQQAAAKQAQAQAATQTVAQQEEADRQALRQQYLDGI